MGQEPETTEEETSQAEEAQEATESTAQEAGDVEAAKRDYHLRKLREENAKYRTEARKAQERLKEIEDAEKSEAEKAAERAEAAERERDEAVARANETLIRAAVVNEAAKQGAVDPDAALALLPKDAVTITDGEVAGAEQAVKELLEAKTYLLGDQKKPSAGPSGGGVRDTPEPASLDEQIQEAEKAGDWDKAGALKAQKLGART